ncbi:hypothetical protein D9758_011986 [Tetrapyrgos nigripes]|uniref:Protein kinase domain-containing protein n=1 Tax=Tetrapyrgos nigripes TaxID=182062 RepID=A0A8H5CR74_9AGAR|nr:hypothetical protein D9758_011986 [Tetrapyrgos nigripes]
MSDEAIAAHGPGHDTHVLEETFTILHSISPQDEEKVVLLPFLKLRGEEAQYRLDILQMIADYPQRLDQRCYVIKNLVLGKRIAKGTYGALYEGKIAIGDKNKTGIERPNRTDYAVKVVGLYPDSIEIDDCLREAVLWRQFEHPNLLPFLGMYYQDDKREDVCFVSPYMNNGSLSVMLRARTLSQEDMYTLVQDIASGLEYLHGENVIHGDLKPGFRPTRHQGGGTPEVSMNARTSKKGDVYSFGRLGHEILKMYDLPDLRWLSEDSHQVDPTRPEGLPSARDLDSMWDMILQCLDEKPSVRPDAKELLSLLSKMSPRPKPAPDWDDTDPLFTQVRSNIDHGDMYMRLPVPANQTPPIFPTQNVNLGSECYSQRLPNLGGPQPYLYPRQDVPGHVGA